MKPSVEPIKVMHRQLIKEVDEFDLSEFNNQEPPKESFEVFVCDADENLLRNWCVIKQYYQLMADDLETFFGDSRDAIINSERRCQETMKKCSFLGQLLIEELKTKSPEYIGSGFIRLAKENVFVRFDPDEVTDDLENFQKAADFFAPIFSGL